MSIPFEALHDNLLDVHLVYNCKGCGPIGTRDCDVLRGDSEQASFIVASCRVVS